ncbi:MAG: alpha/beta hydrolase, partial [Planctomycetes bacterium]|nr:alpha/beta hydrolase [Planctomycetota bacterium]
MLSIHGGRWIRGTRHDNGAIDIKRWAEMGFFSMCIDYRLVTCSPAPACYQDVLCAIRWINNNSNKYHINKNEVFVIGQSAGGHMASLAATLGKGNFKNTDGLEDVSDNFRAAISVSGAYDLV